MGFPKLKKRLGERERVLLDDGTHAWGQDLTTQSVTVPTLACDVEGNRSPASVALVAWPQAEAAIAAGGAPKRQVVAGTERHRR